MCLRLGCFVGFQLKRPGIILRDRIVLHPRSKVRTSSLPLQEQTSICQIPKGSSSLLAKRKSTALQQPSASKIDSSTATINRQTMYHLYPAAPTLALAIELEVSTLRTARLKSTPEPRS